MVPLSQATQRTPQIWQVELILRASHLSLFPPRLTLHVTLPRDRHKRLQTATHGYKRPSHLPLLLPRLPLPRQLLGALLAVIGEPDRLADDGETARHLLREHEFLWLLLPRLRLLLPYLGRGGRGGYDTLRLYDLYDWPAARLGSSGVLDSGGSLGGLSWLARDQRRGVEKSA